MKKILALVLALVMMATMALAFTSCGGDETEPDPTPDGNNVDNSDVKVDEGIGNANGEGGAYVVTDPQNPEAGAETEDGYIHG